MTDNTFTLGDILAAGPCGREPGARGGWALGLRMAGQPHDAPDLSIRVSIGDVALRCGVEDALWCLRLISDPRTRVRAVMPAVRRALAHTDAALVHGCVASIDRWLKGGDSVDLRAAVLAAAAAWAAAADAAEDEAADAAAEARAAAAWAAKASGDDHVAAHDAERAAQVADLIEMFPPLHGETTND